MKIKKIPNKQNRTDPDKEILGKSIIISPSKEEFFVFVGKVAMI
jgi:hypothetical protein